MFTKVSVEDVYGSVEDVYNGSVDDVYQRLSRRCLPTAQ